MAKRNRKDSAPRGHTGKTTTGHTRDVQIERFGRVTIYKRGKTYSLYYRESGKTVRRRVPGNLTTARIAASKVNAAIEEGSPSPFGFKRTHAVRFVSDYLDFCENVAQRATRTVDRYRAALSHFQDFATAQGIQSIDHVNESMVDDFVKWLKKQQRARNGAEVGKAEGYTDAGIDFILGACRTAFNWARKRGHLPPFGENPFSSVMAERPARRRRDAQPQQILTKEEMVKFFGACDDWQRPIFLVLATYGLRVGELTHLLIEDVDLKQNVVHIRSKPDFCWHVKTSRERTVPIFPGVRSLFQDLIGGRKAGFVFLNRAYSAGKRKAAVLFSKPQTLREHALKVAEEAREEGESSDKAVRKDVTAFLRTLGQIPEKRIRQEFMKVTKKIGRPDVTRAHSLRHFFATWAQEVGMNPLLVQSILGHATLDMTGHYTHLSMDAKRQAMQEMFQATQISG